jgi:hypothetical protein
VETILGLLGLAVFIPCVVGLAAAITWVVIKVSPTPSSNKKSAS